MQATASMTAVEIAELSYRRGVRSAESEPMAVPLELLETETWRSFVAARRIEERHFRGAVAENRPGIEGGK